jgi:hypothetical protein
MDIPVGSKWRGKPKRGLQDCVATIEKVGDDWVAFTYKTKRRHLYPSTWKREDFEAEWVPIAPDQQITEDQNGPQK